VELLDATGIPTGYMILSVIHRLPPPPPPPPDYHATTDDSWVEIGFGEPGLPPIPADFFGPGSDPFDGGVVMAGDPIDPGTLGATSTILQRSDEPVLPEDLPGASGMVEIEIIALSLVSTAPITVTYNGGLDPEFWNVHVGLSAIPPPFVGWLSATKTHQNGGTFDSGLYVQPLFRFTKVGDPGEVRILDTGVEGYEWLELYSSGVPFVHSVFPGLNVFRDPGTKWVSGIDQVDPLDPAS
jgi:hypothetical protein